MASQPKPSQPKPAAAYVSQTNEGLRGKYDVKHQRVYGMNHLKGCWQWECHTSKGANRFETGGIKQQQYQTTVGNFLQPKQNTERT